MWSARGNNSHVYRYSPEGKQVMKIKLPTSKISCVTFGGVNCDRLFISSARDELKTILIRKNGCQQKLSYQELCSITRQTSRGNQSLCLVLVFNHL
ncbi:MAG: SMP-30/gluconolactonase/LRE family protein [Cyanobacteria bacterium J06600_6]